MFSKPLCKQSCKANAVVWGLVTFATCFMLAVVILIIGTSDASNIRDSMVKVFQDDYVNAKIDETAMRYYHITEGALEAYEEKKEAFRTLIEGVTEEGYGMVTQGYEALVAGGADDETARATIASQTSALGLTREYVDVLIDYYLACGSDLSEPTVSSYIMNGVADGVTAQILAQYGQEAADSARGMMTGAIEAYLSQDALSTTDFAAGYIAELVGEQMSELLLQEGLTYVPAEIEAEAAEAIRNFRGRLLVDPDQDADVLIAELCSSILDEFPEDVTVALEEIQNMDVFGLIVGAVFFKAAGLLLPMVYTIMTANNLIAGQVDSGSMAYVLSTPTKRGKVIFTQMCFLVLSLFSMFALTTLTGVVCLAAIGDRTAVTVSYGEMVLLNLGAFITMFAISGICFLASAWFNRSKQATTWGGGLSMFFLVTIILGMFGSKVIPSAIRIDAMNYFNYVTIISLFDSISILNGTLTFLWKLAILAAIGIACYAVSAIRFRKKDLPL